MSQSSIIFAVIIVTFIIYITVRNQLATYIGVLVG